MRRTVSVAAVTLLIVVALAGCAPQAAPAPSAPSPTTTAPVSQPIPAGGPAASAEDAAWSKLVSDARKEGLLTIYSFYFVSDIGRALAERFQERYGIRVEILPSSGRAIVSRIEVEQKIRQPIADVANTGVSSATELMTAGLTEGVVRELPVLRDKNVFIMDPSYSPEGEILFMGASILAPIVNTNLVKPQDEPRSWRDLLDPKWKGKIVATDPRGGGSGTFTWFTVSKYYKVLDDEYWRAAAPLMVMYGGSAQELYKMVARGEYSIGHMASDESIAHLVAEGAPLKPLVMDEGQPAQGVSINAIKSSPHPNAAKLFLNWILTAEGQEVYGKAASTGSIRKDVRSFLPAGAQVKAKKVYSRTFDAAEEGNKIHKSGLTDQIFGKK